MRRSLAMNKAWWDERAALHGADGFYYDTGHFLAGELAISEREVSQLREATPDLIGIDLLHLQCHFGLGTLSLARLGARLATWGHQSYG